MRDDDHSHWRDGIAAHLLGALEPEETAALERHLEECGDCRAELRWLTAASETLPESVERVEAPEALRERILAEARSDAAKKPAGTSRRRWGFSLRPAIALAAVAVLVVALAGYAIQSGGGAGTTAPAGAARVTAKVERRGGQGILRLARLQALPPDRVYEAWVWHGGRVAPAGALFEPNPDGTATAVIGHMNGVDAVMVTAEPRGGSAQPTSEPIVSVPTIAE